MAPAMCAGADPLMVFFLLREVVGRKIVKTEILAVAMNRGRFSDSGGRSRRIGLATQFRARGSTVRILKLGAFCRNRNVAVFMCGPYVETSNATRSLDFIFSLVYKSAKQAISLPLLF